MARDWLISEFRLALGGRRWTAVAFSALGKAGILQVRNGYFWDPAAQEYFIPRGIAYQSWNPPVGANQSFAQIDYDLLEFKKMYANSVRSEFVWGEVQVGENEYNWEKPDHLIRRGGEARLRLFVIIGFQYPPAWFPPEWRGINEQGLTPDVLACLAASKASNVTNCLAQAHLRSSVHEPVARGGDHDCAPMPHFQCPVGNHRLSQGESTARLPVRRSNVLSYLISDVINYEHPEARRAYTNHIARSSAATRTAPRSAPGSWAMNSPTLISGNRRRFIASIASSVTILTLKRPSAII